MKRYIKADITDVTDEDFLTRARIARDDNASPRTLRHIYDSINDQTDLNVLISLAQNRNTPEDILVKLSDHYDETVRECVACNPSTPDATLEKLAHDVMFSVVNKVTYNPKCVDPVAILNRLANLSNLTRNQLAMLAENPKSTAEILTKLATYNNPYIKDHLARHPNTPPDVLTQLSQDVDLMVQKNLAGNPNTPSDVLSQIAYTYCEYYIDIAATAINNKSFPVDTLVTLAADPDIDDDLRPIIESKLREVKLRDMGK